MPSLSIVEDFDGAEQAGFGLLVCHIKFPMHFLLSVAKELSTTALCQ
jgi:hypothetical protein